jgi:hypothetical protein
VLGALFFAVDVFVIEVRHLLCEALPVVADHRDDRQETRDGIVHRERISDHERDRRQQPGCYDTGDALWDSAIAFWAPIRQRADGGADYSTRAT